jgi:hypothetical protein
VEDCSAGPAGGVGVADVFRRFGTAYLRSNLMAPDQAKVLRDVIACRTEALGGHRDECGHCGATWLHYNSCRNRHCPTCQGGRAVAWTAEQVERVVPTRHFHVVFTIPDELRPVALSNRRLVYDLLFAAATDTLLELARDRWDALPGITAVLHTWNRQMAFHPHLHCIVTGGGLTDDDQRWVTCKNHKFLFPVRVLSDLFRGKLMDRLARAHERGELRFVGTSVHLTQPSAFAALQRALYDRRWVVYAKRAFGGPEQVIRYLARYTHRVAIASSRLVSADPNAVVFRTHGQRTCRLDTNEFFRRFLLHTLPNGLRKIRYYGLRSPSLVNVRLPIAQRLAAPAVDDTVVPAVEQPSAETHERRPEPGDRCPNCRVGVVERTSHSLPSARAPPAMPGGSA